MGRVIITWNSYLSRFDRSCRCVVRGREKRRRLGCAKSSSFISTARHQTPPASLSMNYELTRFRTTLTLPLHHQIRAWWSLSESEAAVAFRCICLLPAGTRPPQRSTRPQSSPSPTFWLFLPFRQTTMERRMSCYWLMISDILNVFWGVGRGTMAG